MRFITILTLVALATFELQAEPCKLNRPIPINLETLLLPQIQRGNLPRFINVELDHMPAKIFPLKADINNGTLKMRLKQIFTFRTGRSEPVPTGALGINLYSETGAPLTAFTDLIYANELLKYSKTTQGDETVYSTEVLEQAPDFMASMILKISDNQITSLEIKLPEREVNSGGRTRYTGTYDTLCVIDMQVE
ncbi:MAG: hypothetical protein ACXVA9_04720 [Bdellovibrionales bacterium]